MSLTLGIDCSLRWLNLGLADGERAWGEIGLDVGRGQAERLPGETEKFLAANRAALRDVRLIAVTAGPGYYTGTRVGVAYAAALAEALGIPVAPLSTLQALAFDFISNGLPAAAVVRANRAGLYGALYRGGRNDWKEQECFSGYFEPGAFMGELVEQEKKLAGPAAIVVAESCSWPELGSSRRPLLIRPPSIGANVALAAHYVSPVDPATVRARYLRAPD